MLVLKQLPSLIVFRLEFSLFLQSDVFYSPRILVLINVKSSEVLRHGDAPLFCSMRRHQQRQRRICCSLRELLDGGWN